MKQTLYNGKKRAKKKGIRRNGQYQLFEKNKQIGIEIEEQNMEDKHIPNVNQLL